MSPRSVKHSHEFALYPNPTSGSINVDLVDELNVYTMEIISSQGKKVKTLKIEGNTKIDVSDLVNGAYIYRIYNTSGVIMTDKFIILK